MASEEDERTPLEQESQDSVVYDIRSVPRRRVKLYQLNDEGQWDDKGTGHVGIFHVAGNYQIVMKSEEEVGQILLENRISSRDLYQRQQETLIVFQDPERSIDLALSFQEPEGCIEVWDEIQGHLSNMSDDEQMPLPQPQVSTLKDIHRCIAESSSRAKDFIVRHLMEDGYMRSLLNLLHTCEEQHLDEELVELFKIVRGIVLLNDSAILEILFDDSNIQDTLGILEYDPEVLPQSRMKHRDFILRKAAFKEVVPIESKPLLAKIHQNFRITYVKDVVLPRYLDDGTFGTLNSLLYFNNVEIVTTLSTDSSFLSRLFEKLKVAYAESQDRVDLVMFLQELCNLSKNLQMSMRPAIYRSLSEHGIYDLLPKILSDPNTSVRTTGTDILLSMLNQDASAVRKNLLRQKPSYDLFGVIVEQLVNDTEVGVQMQLCEIIRTLLDFTDTQRLQTERDDTLTVFYDHFISTFCEPIMDTPEVVSGDGFDPRGPLKNIVCDLLCFFLQHHTYRIKYHVLRAGVIQRVMQLAYHREKYLVLSAIRFFRALIATKDDFYVRSIIKVNLFKIVFEVFERNGSKYNLINSAILDLIETIRKDNIKSLVSHIIDNHESAFASVTYVETFKMLRIKYEQNKEPAPRIETRRATATQPNSRHDREDEDEEAYFNRSDEEDEATPSTPPMSHSTLSSNTTSSTGRKPLAEAESEAKARATSKAEADQKSSDTEAMADAASKDPAHEHAGGVRLVEYEDAQEEIEAETKGQEQVKRAGENASNDTHPLSENSDIDMAAPSKADAVDRLAEKAAEGVAVESVAVKAEITDNTLAVEVRNANDGSEQRQATIDEIEQPVKQETNLLVESEASARTEIDQAFQQNLDTLTPDQDTGRGLEEVEKSSDLPPAKKQKSES